ncbi:MAG: caspase family protein [Alphaproteobacteria bacterium]|nr:caspase family protein [Alphaproteobacteria bacterium]
MVGRRFSLVCAMIVTASGLAAAQSTPAGAPVASPLFYYAGAAGRLTTDRDALGGNPFASALVEVLKDPDLTLARFGERLAARTMVRSGGWQSPEVPRRTVDPGWRFAPDGQERRVALVLINADYRKSGVPSLPGALFDSVRVTKALEETGFETRLVLDGNGEAVRRELDAFAARSLEADIAVIYAGGHGVQHKRIIYWILGDYPDPRSSRALASHAFALRDIGKAAKAGA